MTPEDQAKREAALELYAIVKALADFWDTPSPTSPFVGGGTWRGQVERALAKAERR